MAVCMTVVLFLLIFSHVTNGVIQPALPDFLSFVTFCKNNKHYGFSAKACPGGVRFLKSPLSFSDKTCFCPNGAFTTAHENGYFSSRIAQSPIPGVGNIIVQAIKGQKVCSHSLLANDANQKEDIWSIIPLTGARSKEEVFVITANEMTTSAEGLDKYQRFTFGNGNKVTLPNVGKSQDISVHWVNPVKRSGNPHFLFENSETQESWKVKASNNDPNVVLYSAGMSSTKLFLKAVGSANTVELMLDQTTEPKMFKFFPINPGVLQGVGNLECNQPSECEVQADSFIINPPSDEWTSLTPKEINNRLKKETKDMVEYRIRILLENARINSKTYPPRLVLANLAQKVFQTSGKMVIDPELIQMNFRLFEYLYYDKDPSWNLDKKIYDGIKYGLTKCLERTQPIPTDRFTCKSNLFWMAEGNSTGGKDQVYNADKNDMIVELMWKAVDYAHMSCFKYFSFISPNLHHYFEVEMEKLFSIQALQFRWWRGLTPEQRKVYQIVLPGLADEVLQTADSIIEVALTENPVYHNRLRKPMIDRTKKSNGKSEKGCPSDRLIWGGEACCLNYDETNGIQPSLSSFLSAG